MSLKRTRMTTMDAVKADVDIYNADDVDKAIAEKDALLWEVYDHVHCDSEIYAKIRKNLEVSDES